MFFSAKIFNFQYSNTKIISYSHCDKMRVCFSNLQGEQFNNFFYKMLNGSPCFFSKKINPRMFITDLEILGKRKRNIKIIFMVFSRTSLLWYKIKYFRGEILYFWRIIFFPIHLHFHKIFFETIILYVQLPKNWINKLWKRRCIKIRMTITK